MYINQIAFLLIILLLSVCSSKEIVVEYQNGLNDYSGCTDTYLYSIGATPSTKDLNFGTSELLKTAN